MNMGEMKDIEKKLYNAKRFFFFLIAFLDMGILHFFHIQKMHNMDGEVI